MDGREFFSYIKFSHRKVCQVIDLTVSSFSDLHPFFNAYASQKSTGFGGVAGRAIDGNKDFRYGLGSCTHTNNYTPWWKVDLFLNFRVKTVIIWNRLDCCCKLIIFWLFVLILKAELCQYVLIFLQKLNLESSRRYYVLGKTSNAPRNSSVFYSLNKEFRRNF